MVGGLLWGFFMSYQLMRQRPHLHFCTHKINQPVCMCFQMCEFFDVSIYTVYIAHARHEFFCILPMIKAPQTRIIIHSCEISVQFTCLYVLRFFFILTSPSNTSSRHVSVSVCVRVRGSKYVCFNIVNEQLTNPEAKNTVSRARQAPITMSSRKTIRGCCWLIQ